MRTNAATQPLPSTRSVDNPQRGPRRRPRITSPWCGRLTNSTVSTGGSGRGRTAGIGLRHRSGNQVRHRLARTGNRQINVAIHGIAITRLRCHPEAQAYPEGRHTRTDARRTLDRQLSDAVFPALLADATASEVNLADAA